MNNVWVYKYDGTIQCDESSRETSLDEMRQDLAMRIGDKNIVAMEKRAVLMIRLCGMPTGSVNAYEITPEGWQLLESGFVGNGGFMRWHAHHEKETADQIGALPATISALTSTANVPTTIRELIGRPLRVYQSGDPLTDDYIANRVNIEVESLTGTVIVDIWFG